MITYVPVSDPELADALRLEGLLYCGYPFPSRAASHWDKFSVYGVCRKIPTYFCYALEE